MSRFKVGEVAIIAFSDLPDYPVGMEVTILEVIENPTDPSFQYLIDRRGGTKIYASDPHLRKKPGDSRTRWIREPLGSWDECPWRPGLELKSPAPSSKR